MQSFRRLFGIIFFGVFLRLFFFAIPKDDIRIAKDLIDGQILKSQEKLVQSTLGQTVLFHGINIWEMANANASPNLRAITVRTAVLIAVVAMAKHAQIFAMLLFALFRHSSVVCVNRQIYMASLIGTALILVVLLYNSLMMGATSFIAS